MCCLVSQGASKSINQDGVHSYGFSIPLSELAKISEESQVWPGVYQVSIITYLIERFCRTLESHSLSLFFALPFNARKLLWITYGICSLQALVTQLHHVERQIQACENSLREEKEKRRKYYVRIPSYALTACDDLLLKITLIKYLKTASYNESQSPSQLRCLTDLTLASNDATRMLVSWFISPVIQTLYDIDSKIGMWCRRLWTIFGAVLLKLYPGLNVILV